MSERETDYFLSTCLKAGSVASWVFFPPPSLFTQSVQRHTRACLDWVFAPETGQVFQHCALALPPRRHQEAQSVTRPPLLILLLPPFPSLPLIPATLSVREGGQAQ